MAHEVQISQTLRYSKTPVSAALATSYFVDQTGDKFVAEVATIGTVEEQLAKGDIGTIGYMAVRNLDPTNFVQVGGAAGVYSMKIEAGKGAIVPWNSATAPYIKADTASVEVDYLMIEK